MATRIVGLKHVNVRAIKVLEDLQSENDAVSVTSHPSAYAPGKKAQAGGWKLRVQPKWRPAGNVKGVYSVSTTAVSAHPGGDSEVTGRIDCDGD